MKSQGTLTSYIIGFALSIVLTLAAFFVVLYPGYFHMGINEILTVILALAIVQMVVQLFFFLHLGSETGGHWKTAIFLSTVGLVFIIVVGSIWIMSHLNYNMMPAQINQYMQDQSTF